MTPLLRPLSCSEKQSDNTCKVTGIDMMRETERGREGMKSLKHAVGRKKLKIDTIIQRYMSV